MAEMRPGTIDTEAIYRAHRIMREMVASFNESKRDVELITASVRENWVGVGRNAFESQYKTLINKIEDFGNTIKELYDALVEAEAKYEDADVDIHQQLEMAIGH